MKALLLLSSCLVLGTFAGIAQWPPQQPHWPNTYQAAWNEQASFSGELLYTGGQGFYDLPNGHLVWARVNGWADPVCNSSIPLPYDTACSHVIANGNHYLFTPILNQCCLCCTEQNGCGMPNSDGFASFTFAGQSEYFGSQVYQWTESINGIDVAYLETTEDNPLERRWVALFTPYDNYTNVWSFETPVDPNKFQLPGVCDGAAFCPSGVCAYMRNQEPTRLRHSRPAQKLFPLV